MDVEWQISREDVTRVKALVREQASSALVRQRRVNNLSGTKQQVRRKRFWYQMVSMRLTSIQRSGPNSHVANFIRTKPFPLHYEAVCAEKRVDRFIANVLKNAGGIRFSNVIAHQLAGNLRLLEQGEWTRALKQCNRLVRPVSPAAEKEIANYIQDKFSGFGPKQARNFLQALGLTRYEIPIDSRVTRWLNELGFPFQLSATALADVNYYEFVSEAVQRLCAKSHVYPCMLDAAIFASRDGDGWTDANVY